jgi:F0F1-type ATP synthase assembly protein I
MIATILVGVFIGDWLDEKFNNTNKLYTIICSLLAIFLALYLALRDFFKST